MITYTIKRNQYEEYVVRVHKDGKMIGSYFASDKDDAAETAKAMVEHERRLEAAKNEKQS